MSRSSPGPHDPDRPPDRPPERAPGEGTDRPGLRALGPAGAAPLLEEAARTKRTGWLEVEGPWALCARLRIRRGRLVEAVSGQLSGLKAAFRIFLWSEARFVWREVEGDPAGRAGFDPIDAELGSFITEGLRQRALWQRLLRDLPSLAARFEVDFDRGVRGLSELGPDARELCRLCDGRRALGEVLRDGRLADLEAASTIGQLLAARILIPVPEGPTPVAVRAGDEIPAITSSTRGEQTEPFEVGRPRERPAWPLAGLGVVLGISVAILVTARPFARHPSGGDLRPAAAPTDRDPALNTRSLSPPPSDPAANRPGIPDRALSLEPASTLSDATNHPADPAAEAPRLLAACEQARGRGDAKRLFLDCERAFAAGAERADLLASVAQAALERGRFAKAAAYARRAVALDPKLAEAYAYLGFAEAEAGRRREAMAAYRQYLALAPRGRYADDVRAIVRESSNKQTRD